MIGSVSSIPIHGAGIATGIGESQVRGTSKPAKRSAIHDTACGPAVIAAAGWLISPIHSIDTSDPAAHHFSSSTAFGQASTTVSAVPWAMNTGISAGIDGGV